MENSFQRITEKLVQKKAQVRFHQENLHREMSRFNSVAFYDYLLQVVDILSRNGLSFIDCTSYFETEIATARDIYQAPLANALKEAFSLEDIFPPATNNWVNVSWNKGDKMQNASVGNSTTVVSATQTENDANLGANAREKLTSDEVDSDAGDETIIEENDESEASEEENTGQKLAYLGHRGASSKEIKQDPPKGSQTSTQGSPETKLFACFVCKSDVVRNKEDLDRHLLYKHKLKKHRCLARQCHGKEPASYEEKHELEAHLSSPVHAHLSEWSCNFCSQQLKSYAKLSLHYKRYHERRQFTCSDCRSNWITVFDSFTKHRYVHAKAKYNCEHPNCEKSFKTKAILERHGNTHNVGKFVCSRCNWAFNHKDNLAKHKKSHIHKRNAFLL